MYWECIGHAIACENSTNEQINATMNKFHLWNTLVERLVDVLTSNEQHMLLILRSDWMYSTAAHSSSSTACYLRLVNDWLKLSNEWACGLLSVRSLICSFIHLIRLLVAVFMSVWQALYSVSALELDCYQLGVLDFSPHSAIATTFTCSIPGSICGSQHTSTTGLFPLFRLLNSLAVTSLIVTIPTAWGHQESVMLIITSPLSRSMSTASNHS